MKRGVIDTGMIRLAYVDFGGEGPGILLLHGLYGRATTWQTTAAWLTRYGHVVGLDQRGHGLSDKPDDAYTNEHYVEDAARAVELLGLAPALVIGHSMGGLNAWLLAARRPELVRGLVIEDMRACGKSNAMANLRSWMGEWPPFGSLADVRAFFDRECPGWGDYFMEVFAEGPDGYHPIFNPEHMVQSCIGWQDRDHRAELAAIQCPALVVKGEKSSMEREQLQEMARILPQGCYAEVAGSDHVIHYEQPEGWRAAVEPFVQALLKQ